MNLVTETTLGVFIAFIVYSWMKKSVENKYQITQQYPVFSEGKIEDLNNELLRYSKEYYKIDNQISKIMDMRNKTGYNFTESEIRVLKEREIKYKEWLNHENYRNFMIQSNIDVLNGTKKIGDKEIDKVQSNWDFSFGLVSEKDVEQEFNTWLRELKSSKK